MSEGDSSDGPSATITVKFTSSDKAAGRISIALGSTVGDFKEAIRKQFDAQPKRLIFQGRILNKDDQTLSECKLKDGLTVVVQAAPAGSPAPASSASAAGHPTASGSNPSSAAPNPGTEVPAPSLRSAASAIASAASGIGAGPGPGGVSLPVRQAIATIRSQGAVNAQECLSMLTKVIDNILSHPMDERYRKIKRSNPGFQRKVGSVPGGDACMRALGFTEVNASAEDLGNWLLSPTESAWNVLNTGRVEIQAALAQVAASSTVSPPAPAGAMGANASATSPGFLGGLGVLPTPGSFDPGRHAGGGLGPGGVPNMAMIQQMAQNPAMMQSMMNDPSVQAMVRSNPQMARAMQAVSSNPALMTQAINMMQNNPAMMQYAQRMMQDPAALQRASQMDIGGALAAGMAGANAGPGQGSTVPPFQVPIPPTPAPAPAPVPPSTPVPAPTPVGAGSSSAAANATPRTEDANNGGNGDEAGEMTEDELLAEAIRRSMQDS